MIYAYRFKDNSGELQEGFSDDGEVRGSKVWRKVLDKMGKFYCATIAYYVGLNAVLGWPQASWPTSKKNRHL